MTTRRDFLHRTTMAAAGLTLPTGTLAARDAIAERPAAPGAPDVRRPPDVVSAQTASDTLVLRATSATRWEGSGVTVAVADVPGALRVRLDAPSTAVRRIGLRWRGPVNARLLLGDAWERGYGDLEWRAFAPERVMPWYVAAWDGALTHVHGVRTGARALCFWQVDPDGVTLWADVRSGGVGVQLGDRTLDVCDVISRAGRAGESAFAAVRAACRVMCERPRLPTQPVYGSNDWYWAYGRNSAESVRTDAAHVVELSPTGGNRPFAVIDDGWQPEHDDAKTGVGLWDRGNRKFGDMAALAGDVRRAGARPGIWCRPLLAPADAPDAWRLPRARTVLDPTVPEVRQKVHDDVARLRAWGYELIKHDYTTYDLFGRWGSQMGAALTREGWTFAAGPSRTTAEVIDALYATIRSAAGDALVIGCNTVSHLSAGHFEICRTGDDTSGTEWARTRKMGVNTLAFRAPQHGTFYVADADCVGVTNAVPWALDRQWLDLLARSGTMLFVSLAPDALGEAQRRDLRAALARAAVSQALAEPLDWQTNALPSRWRTSDGVHRFDWTGDEVPFPAS